MSTMISEVYDALISAGAPEEKARKAAEAVASYDSPFNQVDRDLYLLKWMLGGILAGVASLVLKMFLVDG